MRQLSEQEMAWIRQGLLSFVYDHQDGKYMEMFEGEADAMYTLYDSLCESDISITPLEGTDDE